MASRTPSTAPTISRKTRDTIAAAMMGAGVAAILAASWYVSWPAGLAVTGVLALTAGVLLGME